MYINVNAPTVFLIPNVLMICGTICSYDVINRFISYLPESTVIIISNIRLYLVLLHKLHKLCTCVSAWDFTWCSSRQDLVWYSSPRPKMWKQTASDKSTGTVWSTTHQLPSIIALSEYLRMSSLVCSLHREMPESTAVRPVEAIIA